MKKSAYNILVIGKDGMLGSELLKFMTAESMKADSCINSVWGTTINDLNIAEYGATSARLGDDRYIKPDIVINCAAYTNTAKCGDMTGGYQASYLANVLGPRFLAQSCAYRKCKLIHISTDYVYSQMIGDTVDFNIECPANIYGCHKLLGEKYVEEAFAKRPKDYLICRTSWLYGPNSHNKTFISKFLLNCYKSLADGWLYNESLKKDPVFKVPVHVQKNTAGRPTSTWFLSGFILNAIESGLYGICDAQQETEHTTKTDKPISRLEWAERIRDVCQNILTIDSSDEKDPLITPYELFKHLVIEGYVQSDAALPNEVIHPTRVPECLHIDSRAEDFWDKDHSRLKSTYQRCYAAADCWQNHTCHFLQTEISSIMPWIKSQLTPEQLRALIEINAFDDLTENSQVAIPDKN